MGWCGPSTGNPPDNCGDGLLPVFPTSTACRFEPYNPAAMVRRTANRLLCRPSSTTLALILVVVAALYLRVYNLDWDDGAYLHPDELHIANVITLRIAWDWPPDFDNLLDPDRSRLNPRADDPLTG